MRLRAIAVALAFPAAAWAFADPDLLKLASPNGEIEFRIFITTAAEEYSQPRLAYQVDYRGKRLMDTSFMGIEIQDQPLLGENVGLVTSSRKTVDETYTIPAGKAKTIRNHYNELIAQYAQNSTLGRRITVEARAYNDGIAFRYYIPWALPLLDLQINDEETQFRFAQDADTFPLILDGFKTGYADQYQRVTLSGIHTADLVAVPFIVQQPGVGWVAVTEAQIENYAGMYLQHTEGRAMMSHLAPKLDEPTLAVHGTAETDTPWRVLMIASDPGELIESNIVQNLNPPSAVPDTSWIKAGKAVGNDWSGAPVTTASIDRFIDFAADSKIEYVVIGKEWAMPGEDRLPPDMTKPASVINLSEVLQRAKSKHVGVWLSVDWESARRQMDASFALYEKWGISGVVIGGMNRDDQAMVEFYRTVAKKAAEHRLMIDFRDAYKPDGLSRTYPNVLTREAVMGSDYAKLGARVNPEHDVMLAYTRMLVGPMDHGPGGFDNASRSGFSPQQTRPMSLGTRAHQLALFVVFESPLQMVVDDPDAYKGQQDFEFVEQVPATWDATKFVIGEFGNYVAVARQNGTDWYLGTITDWKARDVEIPLDFLGKGDYIAEIYADAPDAGTNPKHTRIEQKRVSASTKLNLSLASGGGAAIRFRPAN